MYSFYNYKEEKMLFSKQTKEQSLYDARNIFVLTTIIISDYKYDQDLGGIRYTQYYLATEKEDHYFEFFSGIELEEGVNYPNYPDIRKVEPLTKYTILKKVTADFLFSFITEMNATQRARDVLDD